MAQLREKLRETVGVEKCSSLSDKDMDRFLVARKNDVNKAASMLNDYLGWYHAPLKGMGDRTPAAILDVPETEDEIRVWRTHFPFAYTGHDMDGCPIYYERAGVTIANFAEGKKHFNEDRMLWHHVMKQEWMTRKTMTHASEFYGREIYQQVVVCDMKDIRLSVDTSSLQYFIKATAIDQNYYPERLKRFFIINAPWFFKTIFGMVKPFLDVKTVSKFVFLGENYLPELERHIDPSQIPEYLGGKNTAFVWDSVTHRLDSPEFMAKAIPNWKPATAPQSGLSAVASAVVNKVESAVAPTVSEQKPSESPNTNVTSASTDGASLPLTFSGYAEKKSGTMFVGLQLRYFVLGEDGIIHYYKTREVHEGGGSANGKIELRMVKPEAVDARGGSLISKTKPTMIEIPVENRVYEIHCDNESLASAWAQIIVAHVQARSGRKSSEYGI